MRPSPAPQAVCLVCLLTGNAHRRRTGAGLNSHELSSVTTCSDKLTGNGPKRVRRHMKEGPPSAKSRPHWALADGRGERFPLHWQAVAGRPAGPDQDTGPGRRGGGRFSAHRCRGHGRSRGVTSRRRWPLLRDVTQMPTAAPEVTAGHGGRGRPRQSHGAAAVGRGDVGRVAESP